MATLMQEDAILYIIKGSLVTLKYALSSIGGGILIAILLSFCNFSRITLLKYFAMLYVSIFRGTPLLIQLSIIYYAIPSLTGYKIAIFYAGTIAFSLNSGAYVSEILRAGINSVDKGQFEAAKTLGISTKTTMLSIIMPQAVKNILPSLVNELINLLKESAIISVIGEADLMRRATIVSSETYIYFTPLLIAGLCYYIMVMILTWGANLLARKCSV